MPSPHIELPQMPEPQLFHRCLTRSAMIGGFPNRRYTRHLVVHQAAGYQKSFVMKDFSCLYPGKCFMSKRYVIQQPGSNLIADCSTFGHAAEVCGFTFEADWLVARNSELLRRVAKKEEKRSIKNWMGPYQRTPKEVARAIRFSGLGVCSVGPVGDFLDKGDCDVNSSKFRRDNKLYHPWPCILGVLPRFTQGKTYAHIISYHESCNPYSCPEIFWNQCINDDNSTPAFSENHCIQYLRQFIYFTGRYHQHPVNLPASYVRFHQENGSIYM